MNIFVCQKKKNNFLSKASLKKQNNISKAGHKRPSSSIVLSRIAVVICTSFIFYFLKLIQKLYNFFFPYKKNGENFAGKIETTK